MLVSSNEAGLEIMFQKENGRVYTRDALSVWTSYLSFSRRMSCVGLYTRDT